MTDKSVIHQLHKAIGDRPCGDDPEEHSLTFGHGTTSIPG